MTLVREDLHIVMSVLPDDASSIKCTLLSRVYYLVTLVLESLHNAMSVLPGDASSGKCT